MPSGMSSLSLLMLRPLIVMSKELFDAVRIALFVLMVILAIFIILVVIFQPGSSSGLGSISGQSSESFYGKNKGKTMDGKLRKMTVVAMILLLVLSVVFFLGQSQLLFGIDGVVG